jgi:hypothetical protein
MSIRQKLTLRSFARLPNNTERHDVPQLYRTHGERAAGMHWLYRDVVDACRERWGGVEVTVEAQCAVSRPTSTPGLPVWHRLPASETGEVAIACLGPVTLLEFHEHDEPVPGERNNDCAARLAGEERAVPAPVDALVFAPAGATVRFRDYTGPNSDFLGGQTFVVVLLIRPLDDGAVSDRVRFCSRQFEPDEKILPVELPPWAADRSLRFESRLRLEEPLPHFDDADILAEPCFMGARFPDAREHGGPIMQAFLDRMPEDWKDPAAGVIYHGKLDELSPGWWPTLSEWHIDGIGLSVQPRADGTPDWGNPRTTTDQRGLCVGKVAPTRILEGDVRLPEAPLGTPSPLRKRVWQAVLQQGIEAGELVPRPVEPCRVFHFGWGDFHTASRAEQGGLRFFIKAMKGRNRMPPLRPFGRSQVVWPSDSGVWPEDPCGVFPQTLDF